MHKYHFIFDKNKKNDKLKNFFLTRYKNYTCRSSNVIVVLGGDGLMLQTLKKYQKYNKPFYGINRGTIGFLMNKFKKYNINKSISKAKLFSISPIEMEAKTKNNKTFSAIAINEVSLLRQSRQTASLQITNGKKLFSKLGTNSNDSKMGVLILISKSLKKLISSNIFIIKPKQKKIRLVFITI